MWFELYNLKQKGNVIKNMTYNTLYLECSQSNFNLLETWLMFKELHRDRQHPFKYLCLSC